MKNKLLAGFFLLFLSYLGYGQTITVNLTPQNPSICSGAQVVLTAAASGGTAPYTYLWSTGETSSAISVNKALTYTVSVTDQLGNKGSGQVTVSSVAKPGAPTAVNESGVICPGSSARLAASAPGGEYQWFDANFVYKFTGPVYNTDPITQNTVFYVQTTVNGCTSSFTPVSVTLIENPTVSNVSVCSGSPATFTANGATTYQWFDGAGNLLQSGGATFTTGPLTASTSFFVAGTTNGCTSVKVEAKAEVKAATPAPNGGGPYLVCAGSRITLSASGVNSAVYDWFDQAVGGVSIISSPDFTTPVLTADKTYYVQATLDGCPGARTAVTITVSQPPLLPSPVSNGPVCYNSPAQLSISNPVVGQTYEWFTSMAATTPFQTGPVISTSALTANTTFYVRTISGACASERVAITVTVKPEVEAPAISGAILVCKNSPTVLTATTPGGGTYEWFTGPSGGAPFFTGPTYTTPALTTNITYYISATLNGCTSPRTAVTIQIIPDVPMPAASPANVCFGSSAVLTATGSDNYQWYDAASGGNLLSSSQTFTTPILSADITYYVQTTTNGCVSARRAVVVTVNPIPAAPTTTTNGPVCYNTPAQLRVTNVGPGTFQWFDSPTSTTVLFTGKIYNTPALTVSTTYYVQEVAGGCTGTRAAVPIAVEPLVNAPTVSPATTCSGTTATLTASAPGGNYRWYDASTGGNLLGTGPSFTTPALTITTVYYVQTTVSGCTSARSAVTVTVTAPVSAPSAAPTSTCSGNSATLIASGGGNYEWYSALTGGTLLESGQVFVTPALTSDATYYVQSSVNGCASPRTAVTVTVNPLPSPPSINSVSAICARTNTTITASGAGPIQWYSAASGGTLLFTGNSFTTPILTTNTTYYAQTSDGTCTSNRSAVTVQVTPVDNSSFAYTSGTYCTTSPNPTPIPAVPGGTFSAAPAGLSIDPSTGTINIAASVLGSYTITYTTNGTCPSSTEAAVAIVTAPLATFSYNNSPYCQNDSDPLPTFSPGASGGVFSSSPGGLVFESTTTGRIDLSASQPGTYTIKNTINSPCGTVSATTQVVIEEAVVIDAGTPQTIESGTSASLSGSVNMGLGVTWSAPPGTGVFTNANSLNATFTPSITNGTVTLTLTSDDPGNTCGPRSDQVIITVSPKPAKPSVASTSVAVCEGDRAPLSATGPGGTYRWYDDPTTGNLLSTGANFLTPALTTGATYYVQTTVNGINSDRTAVVVTVNSRPAAPVASNPAPVCPGSPVILTATGSGILSWYDVASGGVSLGSGPSYNIASISSTKTFYVESNNGTCSSSTRTAVTVTVTPAPVAPTANGASICYNATATLTATGSAGSYEWFDAQTGGNSLGVGPTYTTLNLTANTTVYVQTTVAGCTSARSAVLVTVGAMVAPPTVAPASTCLGSSATLTATGGSNYEWFDAQTGGNSLGTGPNYTTPVLNADAVYWVQSTVGGCTSERTMVTVTVDPMIIAVAGPTSVCQGKPATFTVSGSSGTYQWYDAPTGGNLLSVTATYTTTDLIANATFYVQTTVGSCVSPRTRVDVSVSPAPVVKSAPTGEICGGTAQNYTITADLAGANFTYSRAAVNGISNPTVTNFPASQITEQLINTTSTDQTVVYVITPYLNGCAGEPFNYTVTVLPSPSIIVSPTKTVCNRAGVDYYIETSTNPTYFSWSRSAVPGISNPAIADQESRTLRESLENTTNHPIDVVYTFNYGTATCPGTPFTLTVTVNPPVYVISPSFKVVCAEEPVNYEIISNADATGATFRWIRLTPVPGNPAPTPGTSKIINETLFNNTNAAIDVYYDVIPVLNGCDGTPFPFHFSLKPRIPKPVVLTNSPVCLDKEVNLNVTGLDGINTSGARYVWTSSTGFTSETTVPFINIPATTTGTVTYNVTVIINECSRTSDDVAVDVNQKPVADAGASQTLCPDVTSIPLNGQVNGGLTGGPIAGQWAIVTGSGSFADAVNQKTNTYIPSAADKTKGAPPVVLSLTSASPDDCEPAISLVTFTFDQVRPSDTQTERTLEICSGGQVTYDIVTTGDANPGMTYSWVRTDDPLNPGTSKTINQTLVNNTAADIVFTYNITPSLNGCVGETFQLNVTVKPAIPKLAFTAPPTTCINKAIVLTHPGISLPNAIYIWTGPDGVPVTTTDPTYTFAGISTPGPAIFNLTVKVGNCEVASDPQTVEIIPIPVVDAGADLPYCPDVASIPLHGVVTRGVNGPSSGGKWVIITGQGQLTNANQLEASYQPAAAERIVGGTVVLQLQSNDNCDVITDDVTFTFDQIHPADTQTERTQEICSGGQITYDIVTTGDATPGITYAWVRAAIGGNAQNSGTSKSISETLINNTGSDILAVYTITPSLNGCAGETFQLRVTVKPAIPKLAFTAPPTACINKAIVLTHPGSLPNAQYTWTGPDGVPHITDVPTYTFTAGINTPGQATFNLTIKVGNCEVASNPQNVDITPLPVIDAGTDMSYCPDQVLIPLHGVVTRGVNGPASAGEWVIVQGSGHLVSDKATLENQYQTAPGERVAGTVIVLQLRSTDNCDAVAPDEVTFRLQPIQAANAGADRNACEQGFELNGQILAADGTGKWTGGQGTFVNGRSSLTGMYIPSPGEVAAHSVTLILIADNPNACDNPSDDVTFTLLPPPTVQADASPVRYVAKGKTIALNPIVSDQNVTYLWTESPAIGSISNPTAKNPVITGGSVDVTYTVTITDALQCSSATSSVLVKVSPQLTPNNTFTPNADGINDTWVIDGIEAYPKMVVDIYNRLGQPVYHSVGYAQPWDGTSNGKPVPFGVYYFVIDTKEVEQKVTGYITVIR